MFALLLSSDLEDGDGAFSLLSSSLAFVLNSFNRSLKTATVPLASNPLSSQHCTNSAFFIELKPFTFCCCPTTSEPLSLSSLSSSPPSIPNIARSISSHSFSLKNIGAVKIGGSTFNTFNVGTFFTLALKNSNARNPAMDSCT